MRLERQRDERERPVAVVAYQGGRERAGLLECRIGELAGRENVRDRLPRVVLVPRIALPEIGQRGDQFVPHGDRIARAVIVDRHDLIGHAVAIEVLGVHGHRFGVAGDEARVETQVADDEVDAPLASEVAGDDAIPPSLAVLQAGGLEAHQLPAARIVENGDRHPFAHDDQVRAAVAVHVLPHGVGHHADVLQFRSQPPGHVGEAAVSVVLEEHAPGVQAIVPRHHPPSDEEIDVAVAVVIRRDDARAAHVLGRHTGRCLAERSVSVIQVQPVLERGVSNG